MKRFLVLLITLCISGSLFALDNKYEKYFSFQVTPQFEVANGVIKEYVFDSECKNTDGKLSQLDWNLSSLILFNLRLNFNVIRYISVGVNGTFAAPQRSDFMQDYDWLNSVTNGWTNDDPTEQTNFSEHVNELDKLLKLKFSLGGNIFLPAEIKLTPHLSYKYEIIRFSASKGYSKYKSDNFEKKTFSKKVISYEQEMNSLLLGLMVNVGCIPRTSININFDISPMLTFINAIDYHYINKITSGTAFMDRLQNALLIESDMSAQYRFNKNHSAGFFGSIQYIPLSKGDSYKRSIDTNGKFTSGSWALLKNEEGGSERFIWSLGLNYSFSL